MLVLQAAFGEKRSIALLRLYSDPKGVRLGSSRVVMAAKATKTRERELPAPGREQVLATGGSLDGGHEPKNRLPSFSTSPAWSIRCITAGFGCHPIPSIPWAVVQAGTAGSIEACPRLMPLIWAHLGALLALLFPETRAIVAGALAGSWHVLQRTSRRHSSAQEHHWPIGPCTKVRRRLPAVNWTSRGCAGLDSVHSHTRRRGQGRAGCRAGYILDGDGPSVIDERSRFGAC